MNISLTKREAKIIYDTLTHISAWTVDEMADHLDWSDAEVEAWSTALVKFARVNP